METHKQTLGGVQGILQKTGERIVGGRGLKENIRKLTESSNMVA